MNPLAPIIVGAGDDPHVLSVTEEVIKLGHRPVVFDLESVIRGGLSIDAAGKRITVDDVSIDLDTPRRGWLRRLHRADWGIGITTGSLRALELGTWHSAYSWLLETARIDWITDPTHTRLAESKLRQWRAATGLSIRYPKTIITSSAGDVADTFDGEVIVKPLGTGQYIEAGTVSAVFAEPMSSADERLEALKLAPFIVQERIVAARHLRVVTVGSKTWTAELVVDSDQPADWRRLAANHSSFTRPSSIDSTVISGAQLIAAELGIKYSSQDWVETSAGVAYLLDVNPAGQWLFLPPTIHAEVSQAIAEDLVMEP